MCVTSCNLKLGRATVKFQTRSLQKKYFVCFCKRYAFWLIFCVCFRPSFRTSFVGSVRAADQEYYMNGVTSETLCSGSMRYSQPRIRKACGL